jgi:hypothetical protein
METPFFILSDTLTLGAGIGVVDSTLLTSAGINPRFVAEGHKSARLQA